MTHDRSDRIPLPADVSRCEPARMCLVSSKCARYQAAFPPQGASVGDFTSEIAGGTALCPGYIPTATLRRAEEAARPVRPAVRGIV